MKRWDERLQQVFIVPLHVLTQEKFRSLSTIPGITVRQVRHNGEIKWHGDLIYVSQVLAQRAAGTQADRGTKWEVRYSFHLLGTLDQRTKKIVPAKSWHRTN